MYDIATVRGFLTGEHDRVKAVGMELYIAFCRADDLRRSVVAVALQPDGVLRVCGSSCLPSDWEPSVAAYVRLSEFAKASEQYRKEGAQCTT